MRVNEPSFSKQKKKVKFLIPIAIRQKWNPFLYVSKRLIICGALLLTYLIATLANFAYPSLVARGYNDIRSSFPNIRTFSFADFKSSFANHRSSPPSPIESTTKDLSSSVSKMFLHGYLSYQKFAYPQDELKPLTMTGTDSFSGSRHGHLPEHSHGTSVTLIESLSSLLVMGFYSQFKEAVHKLSRNCNFDVDARINLYEWNTRVLGGLVSAHILATNLLRESYNNELLDLAEDLGRRFLPAFDTPTALPYAWINLKYGVMNNETEETTTAECGSLILEMGVLSRLTCDTRYESAALHALRSLWDMRSEFNLFGTKLNVLTGKWIDYSSGIGAGSASFYEYLVKAHFVFGDDEFWTMFKSAYIAVQRHLRYDDVSYIRYKTVDMRTAHEINRELTSDQAFWPSVQLLIGDTAYANVTHRDFFSFWQAYKLLPERFEWRPDMFYTDYSNFWRTDRVHLHPIDRQYPLRAELAESTFFLYQATKDPWYLEVGEMILQALSEHTQVDNGYASIKDVITMEKEDHQPGYFLSEMCKYLYLLYNDSFLDTGNYIFTTRGHLLPVVEWNFPHHRRKGPENYWEIPVQKSSSLSKRVCHFNNKPRTRSACYVPDALPDHTCFNDEACGVNPISCVPRACSAHGYCGDWQFNGSVAARGWIKMVTKMMPQGLTHSIMNFTMTKFNVTLFTPGGERE